MTFTGKILVVVNLFMSFIFMAFAMMVYTTRVDLKGKLEAKAKEVESANAKANAATVEKDATLAKLADAKKETEQQLAAKDQRINQLTAENNRLNNDFRNVREQAGAFTADFNSITKELNERRDEVNKLREYRGKILKENTDLVNEKTRLTDQLAQANNTLKLAIERNEQLLDRTQKLEAYAIKIKGSLPDAETLEGVAGLTAPPDVQGIVKRVDPEGKHLEITLGADDGIRKGHVLEVWRTGPNAKYLGRIRVVDVGNDHAVAKPIASTGGAIQPADVVGPKIMSANRAN